MQRGMVAVALALAAATARAQVQGQGQGQGTASGEPPQYNAPPQYAPPQNAPPQYAAPQNAAPQSAPPQNAPPAQTSDAFDRACIDLLHGQMPDGEREVKTLRDACSSLMAGRANDRLDAERRRQEQLAAQEQLRQIAEGRVQPGRATGQPQQGPGVLAAFGQAGTELVGGSRAKGGMGISRGAPVAYTLVTNPVGWFSGIGVNAELYGAFQDAPKFSWVAGARYSATDATNGTATTFGAEAGVDFFVIGHNNEGLRIGPRMEVAAGRERFQGSTTFARLGFSGELGYNFIATNGITGLLAAGVGGRVAGNNKNDTFASFVGGEFGPYGKVGVGFSW